MTYMFLLAIISMIAALLTQRKHLLMTLLYLESLMLGMVIFLTLSLGLPPHNNTFLFIVLLTFAACEASLGLALLVTMTRVSGSDMIKLLNLNKC